MSCGQGTSARACLTERLPFLGFTLSEAHAKKLELQLTDFIVSEMKREGSTHYRPEAVQQVELGEATEEETPTVKAKGKAKGKAKSGSKKHKKEEKEGAGEADEETSKPPKKKLKTDAEEAEVSDAESLPW